MGGLTALVKICAIAEAAGISVIPHGGGNTPYGQHVCYAMPAIPWTECFVGSAPGCRPSGRPGYRGRPIPKQGRMKPSAAPGFGVEVSLDQLSPFDYGSSGG